MRTDLWPDGAADHATEIAMFFAGTLVEPDAVLIAENVVGKIVGFAELAIRNDLASLEGKNVGYVEGLYVPPEFRGHGIARKLLQASRSWAREQKCAGFASDRAGRIIIDPNF
jgi:aminoglycoside 6'-N-acetyltransferase I